MSFTRFPGVQLLGHARKKRDRGCTLRACPLLPDHTNPIGNRLDVVTVLPVTALTMVSVWKPPIIIRKAVAEP
jgi:hypothetical protein